MAFHTAQFAFLDFVAAGQKWSCAAPPARHRPPSTWFRRAGYNLHRGVVPLSTWQTTSMVGIRVTVHTYNFANHYIIDLRRLPLVQPSTLEPLIVMRSAYSCRRVLGLWRNSCQPFHGQIHTCATSLALKLFQKAQVVLIKQANIVDIIAAHDNALRAPTPNAKPL